MPHVHVHAPHELSDEPAHSGPGADRGERVLELLAILLLSLTTLATAWSGYQAARWSGEQSQSFARASTMRIKAQAQSTLAGQLRIDDLVLFNSWLDAREAGDRKLAAIYRRRFRPDFVPAFDAWIAAKPFTNPDAPLTPFTMPEYRVSQSTLSSELNAQAGEHSNDAEAANQRADDYVLAVVLLASALFFAGISTKLHVERQREALLALGWLIFLGTAIWLGVSPVQV